MHAAFNAPTRPTDGARLVLALRVTIPPLFFVEYAPHSSLARLSGQEPSKEAKQSHEGARDKGHGAERRPRRAAREALPPLFGTVWPAPVLAERRNTWSVLSIRAATWSVRLRSPPPMHPRAKLFSAPFASLRLKCLPWQYLYPSSSNFNGKNR